MSSLAIGLVCSLCVTACAAPALGERVELTGKLVLRGPSEFSAPAVMTRDSGVWLLEGPGAADARSRQNQQVRVRGTVTRLGEGTVIPPSLRVEEIQPAPGH